MPIVPGGVGRAGTREPGRFAARRGLGCCCGQPSAALHRNPTEPAVPSRLRVSELSAGAMPLGPGVGRFT